MPFMSLAKHCFFGTDQPSNVQKKVFAFTTLLSVCTSMVILVSVPNGTPNWKAGLAALALPVGTLATLGIISNAASACYKPSDDDQAPLLSHSTP